MEDDPGKIAMGCEGMNGNDNDRRKSFRFCERCNKKLIERLPNGMWRFQFGRKVRASGEIEDYVPVEIYIWGSLRMKCLKRSCSHWNVFHFFPSFREVQLPSPGKGVKDNRLSAEEFNHATSREVDHSEERGGDSECQEQDQLRKTLPR